MRSEPTIIVTCDRCGVAVEVSYFCNVDERLEDELDWRVALLNDYCPKCKENPDAT